MTIGALIKAISPPVVPSAPFEGPWEPLEHQLGTTLPEDYKALVRLYGHATYLDAIIVHVPRSRIRHACFETCIRDICDPIRELAELPYPLWPEAGGLLPVAHTEFGDLIFWIVDGPPSTWRIFLCDRDIVDFQIFDGDLTGFLAGMASGEFQPEAFAHLAPEGTLFNSWGRYDGGPRPATEDWTRSSGYGQTTVQSVTLSAQLKPQKS